MSPPSVKDHSENKYFMTRRNAILHCLWVSESITFSLLFVMETLVLPPQALEYSYGSDYGTLLKYIDSSQLRCSDFLNRLNRSTGPRLLKDQEFLRPTSVRRTLTDNGSDVYSIGKEMDQKYRLKMGAPDSTWTAACDSCVLHAMTQAHERLIASCNDQFTPLASRDTPFSIPSDTGFGESGLSRQSRTGPGDRANIMNYQFDPGYGSKEQIGKGSKTPLIALT